jgi:hypothetical protein
MDEIPETRRSLRRHIGHHLEEIALAALPPEIYHMDDGTGDGGATGGDVENTDRNTEVIASSNDSEGGDPLLLSDLAESTGADTLTDGIQQTDRDLPAIPTVGHRATPNPDSLGEKHSKTNMDEGEVYVNDTRRDLTPSLAQETAVESGTMTGREARKFKDILSRIKKQTQEQQIQLNKRRKRSSMADGDPSSNSSEDDVIMKGGNNGGRERGNKQVRTPATAAATPTPSIPSTPLPQQTLAPIQEKKPIKVKGDLGQRESDAASALAGLLLGMENIAPAPPNIVMCTPESQPLPQPRTAASTPKKEKGKGGRSAGAATSSYWSVPEQNDFPHLLASFGTNWGLISQRLPSKTTVMVWNFVPFLY